MRRVREFRVGDQVGMLGGGGLEGRVVACRKIWAGRRKLWIKDSTDAIQMVVIGLHITDPRRPAGEIYSGPVDVATADDLARQVLEGREIRLPIELQLNTLATAVLQADRPKDGEETAK